MNYLRESNAVRQATLFLLIVIGVAMTQGCSQTFSGLQEVSKPDLSSSPVLKPRAQATVPESFKENPFIDKNPAPQATAKEKKRGYLLFSRPITQPVYRGTQPYKWDRTEGISAFGTPGEYEPLTFSLYPLRNIKDLRVKVSALKSDNAEIKTSDLDLRAVTYWNLRFPRYTSKDTYRAVPELLEKVNSIDLTKEVCQRFWLKVHIPSDAKPGLYKGYVTIYESGAKKAWLLPMALRVLDYKLKRDPQKRYSVYYYGLKYQFKGLEGKALEKARENELKSMRSYGIDMFPTISLGATNDKNKDIQVYMRDDALVDSMLKLGFKGPIPICGGIGNFYRRYVPEGKIGKHWHVSKNPPDDKIYAAIERAFRNLKKDAEKKGWPDLICCPLDEVASASAEFSAKVYAAIRRAGIKTYITKDPTSVDSAVYRKLDAVDAWCSQPYAFPYDKVIADKRYQYWTYPNHNAGELKDRVIMQKGGRMTYGFGLWRSGYTTIIPWHWRWLPNREDQFDYLRGRTVSGCGARMNEKQEVIPAVYWECFREGYDDLRYLYTLQDAIVKREGSKNIQCKKLIEKAKRLIQNIWDSIDPQVKYLNTNMWTDETFNAKRWQIASLTQELLKYPAVNKKIAPSVLAETQKKAISKDAGTFIAESMQKGFINQYDLSKNNYKNWRSVSSEVSLRTVPVKGKTPSLQFNVNVDHNVDGGGEGGNYPIGWPRIREDFKPGQLDLTKYDYLYFKVKVDSNRSEVADDKTPFIVNFAGYSKGVKYDVRLDLGDKQRTWVPVTLSLRHMMLNSGFSEKEWKNLKHIQLVIAEGHYSDNTKLEFEIRDIALLKFNRPIIQAIDSSDLVIRPQKHYLVKVKGFGFEDAAKQTSKLVVTVSNSAKETVLNEKFPLSVKPQFVFDFASFDLGSYKLTVSVINAKGKTVSTKSKIIKVINGFL
jgi:glycosyl hydrolase family 123